MVAVRRILLIVNPASRRGLRSLAAARRAFARAEIRCDEHLTTGAGDAEQVARRFGPGYDAVFSLGGDGTVMEVVQGLYGTGTPVGILAGGTGNLVARALGIPMSVGRAVRLLLAGATSAIDLGALGEGRVFAFAAGVGIDASMVAQTTAAAKRRFGVLAYVATAVRATLALDRFVLHATVDDVTHTYSATSALVANFGSVLGGWIRLGPGIQENDGMLDLCVFSPATARDAFRVGWRLLRRDFRSDPSMHFHKGRTLLLRTEPARAVQADGELLPGCTLQVTVAPRAARMLVPSARR
ncbi:MAG: diacylglycerol kinase family protein [Gemmatimonadota bacterium]